MYRYEGDAESNGPLLLDSPSKFSMEPRPVWPQESVTVGLYDRWDLDPSSTMRAKLKSPARRYHDLISFSNDALRFVSKKTQHDIINIIEDREG